MKKIHITLVGAQPAPIYNGIIATSPHKIIYIYSNSENSYNSLKVLKKELKIDADEIQLDVTNPTKIKYCAEQLADIYKNHEVTVNITSGLKSWAYWFSVVFAQCENASVIYFDQNNVLWNYRTMQSSTDFNFDMHTLFRLYGNPIENNYTPFSRYTPQDFETIKIIEEIRESNFSAFKELTSTLSIDDNNILRNNDTGKFVKENSSVRWDRPNNKVIFNINNKSTTISSPHVVDLTFHTAWFELKVAQILSKWDKAKEICLNCRFPFNAKFDKNEVDIIVNTGNKILFVECKTQIANTTDIDKFRSVIKGYGGIGSKGLFITDSKMKAIAKKKCKEHNILYFSLGNEHLLMSTEKALFRLLNNELYNINAK